MNLNQYSNDNVILNEPVKNQIFNDSTFSRIVYSNHIITTNGIHLKLDIKGVSVDKKLYKNNVLFNIYNNRDLITCVQSIETLILSSYDKKDPIYTLRNELNSGRITVHDCKEHIVLKISGVWETELNCGITYKFIGA